MLELAANPAELLTSQFYARAELGPTQKHNAAELLRQTNAIETGRLTTESKEFGDRSPGLNLEISLKDGLFANDQTEPQSALSPFETTQFQAGSQLVQIVEHLTTQLPAELRSQNLLAQVTISKHNDGPCAPLLPHRDGNKFVAVVCLSPASQGGELCIYRPRGAEPDKSVRDADGVKFTYDDDFMDPAPYRGENWHEHLQDVGHARLNPGEYIIFDDTEVAHAVQGHFNEPESNGRIMILVRFDIKQT